MHAFNSSLICCILSTKDIKSAKLYNLKSGSFDKCIEIFIVQGVKTSYEGLVSLAEE